MRGKLKCDSFLRGVIGVKDFFASLRLQCGELSRDSHISALVLNIRTAVSQLRSTT